MADPAALQERIDLLEDELRTVHAQVDLRCRQAQKGMHACLSTNDALLYASSSARPLPAFCPRPPHLTSLADVG
jgi:hypothetical protein